MVDNKGVEMNYRPNRCVGEVMQGMYGKGGVVRWEVEGQKRK